MGREILIHPIAPKMDYMASVLGFTKGMASNVWVFKVQNGEYRGADEPPKPQNFVRPSK